MWQKLVLCAFSLVAVLAQTGAASGQSFDARSFVLMGANGGQRESDSIQYHTEGYTQCFNTDPSWCNDLTPGVKARGGFHKSYWMSATAGQFLVTKGQPCVPYVHNMKSSDGRVAEFACDDATNGLLRLVWEGTTDFPRSYARQIPGSGLYYSGIPWFHQFESNGSQTFFNSWVKVYQCVGNPVFQSQSFPNGGFEVFFFEITTAQQRQAAIASIRQLGLVPASQPDAEVIPAAWYQTFPQAIGRAGQHVHLMVRKDYLDLFCGNFSCKNYVETYWYGAVTPASFDYFGLGLLRWNVQSLAQGKFFREVANDTWVTETGSARTRATALCH